MLLMAGFLVREATAAKPLLPLAMFRSRAVSGANLIQVLLTPAMFGMSFLGALYLRQVLGYDPWHIGLAFLPAVLTVGALSFRYSARLSARFGGQAVLLAGLALVTAGLALFARAPAGASYALDILPPMLLAGTGVGIAFPAIMTLGMSEATTSDSGLVSGVINTTANVGGSLGLAVLATVATTRTDRLAKAGHSATSALLAGYHLAFAVSAAIAAAALLTAATVLRTGRRPGHKTESPASRT
jgi:MFS family permease